MNARLKRAVRIVSGWGFLLLGAAGLFLPVLQGILFLTIGAFLLAPYVRFFRKMQIMLYRRFPRARGFATKLRKRARRCSAS